MPRQISDSLGNWLPDELPQFALSRALEQVGRAEVFRGDPGPAKPYSAGTATSSGGFVVQDRLDDLTYRENLAPDHVVGRRSPGVKVPVGMGHGTRFRLEGSKDGERWSPLANAQADPGVDFNRVRYFDADMSDWGYARIVITTPSGQAISKDIDLGRGAVERRIREDLTAALARDIDDAFLYGSRENARAARAYRAARENEAGASVTQQGFLLPLARGPGSSNPYP